MGETVIENAIHLIHIMQEDVELYNTYWGIVENIETLIEDVIGNKNGKAIQTSDIFDEVMKSVNIKYAPIVMRIISEACDVPVPSDKTGEVILYHRLLEFLNSVGLPEDAVAVRRKGDMH